MDKIDVLLVEDEPTLAMIIKETLDSDGFCVSTAADGVEGLKALIQNKPQVVVTDIMMPRMDGFEMVRHLRATDRLTPVLFLTARSSVEDVVEGLATGADDYLRKPFSMMELAARLRALVERRQAVSEAATMDTAQPTDEVHIGGYTLNTTTQQLSFAGRHTTLSHRESELLHILATHRGDVVTQRDMLLALWGNDSIYNARSLQVFITHLRHKLSEDSHIQIINVRGIGYKLVW